MLGPGSIIYNDGEILEGSFTNNNYLNGQGIRTFPNGDRQEGIFNNNKLISISKLVYLNRNATYIGHFTMIKGRINGKGKLTIGNDNDIPIYEGEFIDGILQGEGLIRFPDNKRHVGTFVDSILRGTGSIIYDDGTTLKGTFTDNNYLNGKGIRQCSNGDTYEGIFNDNILISISKMFNSNATYIGDFILENGSIQGTGKLTLHDGTLYEGEFKNSIIYNGTIKKTNGDIINITNGDHIMSASTVISSKNTITPTPPNISSMSTTVKPHKHGTAKTEPRPVSAATPPVSAAKTKTPPVSAAKTKRDGAQRQGGKVRNKYDVYYNEYYNKYLKYKNKYLTLANKISNK